MQPSGEPFLYVCAGNRRNNTWLLIVALCLGGRGLLPEVMTARETCLLLVGQTKTCRGTSDIVGSELQLTLLSDAKRQYYLFLSHS